MITFKKSIDDISLETQNASYNEAVAQFYNLQAEYSNTNINGNILLTRDALCRLISAAVAAGVKETLTSLYTNEDFESDIQLK